MKLQEDFSWQKLRAKAKRKQKLYTFRTLTHLAIVLCGFILDLKQINFSAKKQILLFAVLYLLYVLGVHLYLNFRYFLPKKGITAWNRIKTLSTLIAILFLSFWLRNEHLGFDVTISNQYHTFFHAGFLMAFISIAMNYKKAGHWWQMVDITPGRMVFILYGLVSFISTFFLILPVSLQPGAGIELIDAFFVSVSALAVTGLTPINIADTFSTSGLSILLFLIQLGGLGIVIISVGLAVLTRNRLSLSQSLMGKELYDLPSIGSMGPFLKRVLLFTVIAELIGWILIWTVLPANLSNRGFHALFHAISAFCNAGFSSFPNNLNVPGLASMKSIVCLLVLIGGIGFPVIFEIIRKMTRKKAYRPLSSNTVLTLTVTASLLFLGAIGIFFIETFETASQFSGGKNLIHGLFYTISARTAGFNLAPIADLTYGSQLLIAFLMVVGGSPLSTAGGIKTTTVGVILIAAASLMRGHKWLQFRTSEINYIVLQKAVTLVVLYSIAMFIATLALVAIEPSDPWAIVFEVISALSTVGLSLGVTEELSSLSKVIVIGLMLTGRLGLVTMVYIGFGRSYSQRFRYSRERFYVG